MISYMVSSLLNDALGGITHMAYVIEELTGKLQNSLNPITNYKLGITSENLSTIEKWNLK